ncbi:conserved hypothetical protein [Neisseria gonorrhoeae DGI2]|nr:conserved hypothetical protein [Neisseria gonorrhoeae DGI2]
MLIHYKARQWDTNINLNPNPNLHPDSDDSRFRKPPKKTNPAKAGFVSHHRYRPTFHEYCNSTRYKIR